MYSILMIIGMPFRVISIHFLAIVLILFDNSRIGCFRSFLVHKKTKLTLFEHNLGPDLARLILISVNEISFH
jgi:hypothetical protein